MTKVKMDWVDDVRHGEGNGIQGNVQDLNEKENVNEKMILSENSRELGLDLYACYPSTCPSGVSTKALISRPASIAF